MHFAARPDPDVNGNVNVIYSKMSKAINIKLTMTVYSIKDMCSIQTFFYIYITI